MSTAKQGMMRLLPAILALAAILSLRASVLPALAQTGSSSVTISITDTSYQTPATLPSGRVAITFINKGTGAHGAQIIVLNPGVTLDQFMSAAQKVASSSTTPADVQAFFALVQDGGGVGTLAPGQSATVVNTLPAGNAVLIDFEGAEQVPISQPITVAGPAVAAPEPQANVDVTMMDDAYQMPSTIPSGTVTFKITNTGQDYHEFQLYSVGTHTLADLEAALQGPQPPDWAANVGGSGGVAPGDTAWVSENLQPGNYVALCFIPDPQTGMPHFLMGMITEFHVGAAGAAPTATQPQTSTPEVTPAPLMPGGGVPTTAPSFATNVSSAGSAFTVTMTDSGNLTGVPNTVAPGPTQITFVDGGTQPGAVMIFQPKPGVTLDQLTALGNSQQDFVKLLSMITAYSGADELSPGMRENVTVNLPAGDFVMINTDNPSAPPSFFTVSGDPTGAHDPQADYVANEHDNGSTFRFDLPTTVAPGVNTIKVTNTGTEKHEFELVFIGSHTLADVQASLQDPNSPQPPWAISSGGLNAQDPGMTSWVTADFQQGNYAVLCFMPDPTTGLPHAFLGMVGIVAVP